MSNSTKHSLDRLAEMFKALANPHRLKIFIRLAECCCAEVSDAPADGTFSAGTSVGDLGKGVGVVPSTVSHHLKELRRAGLIQMSRCGKSVMCWVEPQVLDSLSGFFAAAGVKKGTTP